VFVASGIMFALASYAQDNNEAESGERADDNSIEEIVVTGSRLRNVAPTGHFFEIDREQIDRLGLTSAEDIIRYLPQNHSVVTSGSTTTAQGASAATPSRSLGQASVGLRGLGANATLVLVNGRRVASSPIYDGDGTINLNGIPASAVERVEVLMDGASAIYGSDALGGVVNFILRKDYSGSETKLRYENAANDGNVELISQILGTNWNGGNVTLSLEHKRTDSADTDKASSHLSLDYTPFGGPDYRDSGLFGYNGPNGNVFFSGALPPGTTGNSWTIDDLSYDNVVPYDRVARGGAGTNESEETAVALRLSQEVSPAIILDADILYSTRDNYASNGGVQLFSFVPASNPFNQLGFGTFVLYAPPEGSPMAIFEQWSDQEELNANLGARFALPRDWRLGVDVGLGESSITSAVRGANRTPAFTDALNGFTVDASGAQIPVPALNFFTGEHDPAIDFDAILGGDSFASSGFSARTDQETVTDQQSIEVTADGKLFEVPGGNVSLMVGTQYREESIDYGNDPFIGAVYGFDPNGSAKLDRDVAAIFFESSIPLIGSGNARQGAQEFLISVAGRYEEYNMTRAFDGANEETIDFNEFSPRIGLKWQIVDAFGVRASWGESFRAPGLAQLARPLRDFGIRTINDPDAPGATPGNPVPTPAQIWRGGNKLLRPETADTLSAGIYWTPADIDGLSVAINYSDIEWVDRIGELSYLDQRLLSNSLAFPDIYQRDANGNLVSVLSGPTNISKSNLRSWDLNVNYLFEAASGSYLLGLNAVYTDEYGEVLVEGDPEVDRSGTELGPDTWVARARFGWSRSTYGADLFVNYSSSYDNTNNLSALDPPLQKVDSYTTVDVTGFYSTANDWKFSGGVRNLLDEDFPLIFSRRSSYDPTRVDPRGRVVYAEVSKSFEF